MCFEFRTQSGIYVYYKRVPDYRMVVYAWVWVCVEQKNAPNREQNKNDEPRISEAKQKKKMKKIEGQSVWERERGRRGKKTSNSKTVCLVAVQCA